MCILGVRKGKTKEKTYLLFLESSPPLQLLKYLQQKNEIIFANAEIAINWSSKTLVVIVFIGKTTNGIHSSLNFEPLLTLSQTQQLTFKLSYSYKKIDKNLFDYHRYIIEHLFYRFDSIMYNMDSGLESTKLVSWQTSSALESTSSGLRIACTFRWILQ